MSQSPSQKKDHNGQHQQQSNVVGHLQQAHAREQHHLHHGYEKEHVQLAQMQALQIRTRQPSSPPIPFEHDLENIKTPTAPIPQFTGTHARGAPHLAPNALKDAVAVDQSQLSPTEIVEAILLECNHLKNPSSNGHAHDELARKAYFLYLDQGAQDGHDLEHWLKAETEILNGVQA